MLPLPTSILFLVTMLCLQGADAQFMRSMRPSAYAALGTYSRNFSDVFSFVHNQAALPRLRKTSAGIYMQKKYMIKELDAYEAALAFPLKEGSAGVTASYTGFSEYSQSQFGIAYGLTLGEKMDLGAQVDYNVVRIAGYGNATAINFQIGCLLHLSEKMHAGLHVYNPLGGKFGKGSAEKLPSIYTVGLAYEVSEKLLLNAEVIKEENQHIEVNYGLHYSFVKQFFVRAGFSPGEDNSFFGAGVKWKNFRTDIALSWHPQLGFTPSFLLIFNFAGEKTEDQ